MGVEVVIYRSSPISLEEWRGLVLSDSTLRLRSEPYSALNPKSREQIKIAKGVADTEIQRNGEWVPFLRWRRGALIAAYMPEFELSSNQVRLKLVQVAKQLHATLGTDAGDEALDW